MLQFALAENFESTLFSDGTNTTWLEALPARIYHTPMYGEVPVTVDKLQRMVDGFKKNVRGQDIAVNFDHGMDRAKGNKAAGWYKDFAIGTSTIDGSPVLKALVQFTDQAAQEIKNGEWKYFSMEWDDVWQDNTGVTHEDVVTGGALTNRPVAKHMQALPVNFSESQWSELDEETRNRFAEWTTAYKDNLPDSAFLYVESEGGEGADSETKNENRHLPYKDKDGKVDLYHLRNAISRLSQSATGTGQNSWLTDALRKKLLVKARSILTAHTKNMSEEVIKEVENGTLILTAESKEWEHSEPGTGPAPQYGSPEQPDPGTGQPVPRIQGDPAGEDPAIGGGWRREPLPRDPADPDAPHSQQRDNGGSALKPEELAELRKKLNLPDDADAATIISTASTAFSEAETLRSAVAASDEEKRFAETHPIMFAEHQKLLAESRETRAMKFSESVADITKSEGENKVKTGAGLSALALEKVSETHKKFSEGTVTTADFEETIRTIVDGGIVEFGERGSSKPLDEPQMVDTTHSTTGIAANRKLFAEKVLEIQKQDNLEYGVALTEAAKQYPELAAAYKAAAPA